MDEVPNDLPQSIQPGNRIRFVAGTFEGFRGTVESINRTEQTVTAGINIYGRLTVVEVPLSDVAPGSDERG